MEDHKKVDSKINVRKSVNDSFYGNYSNYFKKRNFSECRVSHINKDWITNKSCLDIGCNIGFFPVKLTKTYRPASMVAIDRDSQLIKAAMIKIGEEVSKISTTCFIPRSVCINNQHFLKNITFLCADVFSHIKSLSNVETYDFISCMSVIKWIHLEYGDDKTKELFRSIFNILRTGGIFALEYQPWKSYKNARRKSNNLNESFKNIRMYPEKFEHILVSEIGFEILSRRGSSLTEAKGYNRPILICQKKGQQKTLTEHNIKNIMTTNNDDNAEVIIRKEDMQSYIRKTMISYPIKIERSRNDNDDSVNGIITTSEDCTTSSVSNTTSLSTNKSKKRKRKRKDPCECDDLVQHRDERADERWHRKEGTDCR